MSTLERQQVFLDPAQRGLPNPDSVAAIEVKGFLVSRKTLMSVSRFPEKSSCGPSSSCAAMPCTEPKPAP